MGAKITTITDYYVFVGYSRDDIAEMGRAATSRAASAVRYTLTQALPLCVTMLTNPSSSPGCGGNPCTLTAIVAADKAVGTVRASVPPSTLADQIAYLEDGLR